ncbi:scaffold protein [Microviridae sp.]|nr:scaffold protein [Microviridae sp.]UOF81754.1 scaffold protein [Microviridae sp.]
MSIGRKLQYDADGHVSLVPPRVVVEFVGSGRTKQSFKDQCDINFIMARYLKSGSVNHLATHGGQYGDFSPQTFHEAMNIVAKAEQMFADLDSGLRKRFSNDPAEFLKFVQARNDGGELVNLEEMRKLGLARPAPKPEPTPREARIAELEVDREARLELARRAVVAPPSGGAGTVAS